MSVALAAHTANEDAGTVVVADLVGAGIADDEAPVGEKKGPRRAKELVLGAPGGVADPEERLRVHRPGVLPRGLPVVDHGHDRTRAGRILRPCRRLRALAARHRE
jgi:hypothetical protein